MLMLIATCNIASSAHNSNIYWREMGRQCLGEPGISERAVVYRWERSTCPQWQVIAATDFLLICIGGKLNGLKSHFRPLDSGTNY